MASRVPPNKLPTPLEDRPLPPTKDLEVPKDYKQVFREREVVSKFVDPCEAARKASYDCLERTHYNRDECMDFFRAYRQCHTNWTNDRKRDTRAGKGPA